MVRPFFCAKLAHLAIEVRTLHALLTAGQRSSHFATCEIAASGGSA